MWGTLFGTWIRYLIVAAVTAVASNPNLAKLFGPEVVAFLQQESTITFLIAAVINTAVLLWSFKSRIFEKLATLKGIARPRGTTVAEVKAEVKAEASSVAGVSIPTNDQIREAFQAPASSIADKGHN